MAPETTKNALYIMLAILLFLLLAFVAYKVISKGIDSLDRTTEEPWYSKIF